MGGCFLGVFECASIFVWGGATCRSITYVREYNLMQSVLTLLVVNILKILLFGILSQLMLYGYGGSVVAARNMKALTTMLSIWLRCCGTTWCTQLRESMIVLKEHRKRCIRKGENFVKYGGQYLYGWMSHIGYSFLLVLSYFKHSCEEWHREADVIGAGMWSDGGEMVNEENEASSNFGKWWGMKRLRATTDLMNKEESGVTLFL